MGSLTTPPCSEGVQWVVMRHPVAVSQEQLDIFARMYPMNARPLQAASESGLWGKDLLFKRPFFHRNIPPPGSRTRPRVVVGRDTSPLH